jgi:hypothetical protein
MTPRILTGKVHEITFTDSERPVFPIPWWNKRTIGLHP